MRKMNSILAMITILGVLWSTHLFAAGVDLTAIGARAQALGGNYRGVSDDWSAMYWNPAGLVFTSGLKAGFGLEFASPSATYTAGKSQLGGPFSATKFGKAVENEPLNFVLPSLGVYYSNEKYAFGIGAWAPFGLGAKWNLLDTDAYNSNYPEFEWEDNMQVIDIHPTFSYKINEKLSVGVGISLIHAGIRIRKPMFAPNPYVYDQELKENLEILRNSGPLGQNAADEITGVLNSIPSEAKNSPYDHLITDTNLKGDGFGFGANIGIMFKATPCFTVALTAKWYNPITLSGTVTATSYFANVPAAQDTINPLKDIWELAGQIEGVELDDIEKAVLSNMYSDSTYNQKVPEEIEAELALPHEVGIGVCYTGIDHLQISADVSFTQWSLWDIIKVKDSQTGETFAELVENWRDCIRIGVGVEYELLPILKLRGAFYTEPSAAIPATMNPTIPDVNRRNVVLLGIGVPVSPSMNINASFEKMFIGDLTVDEWHITSDLLDYENMAGKYTLDAMTFMVGLDYNF